MPDSRIIQPFITYITLKLDGEIKRFLVSAKQGDKRSRIISALLVERNGEPYSIPEDIDISANIEKPDGKTCYAAATLVDARIEIELTQQALIAAGTAKCDLELRARDSSEILTSVVFEIEIEKKVRNDEGIISSDEMSALDIKLAALNTAIDEEKARQQAEGERASSEAQRKQNETGRVSSESSRAAAETSRKQNESTRTTSENSRIAAESTREQKEAERQAAETNRANNENVRVQDEAARATAEQQRQTDTANALVAVDEALQNIEFAEGDMKEADYGGSAPGIVAMADTAAKLATAHSIQTNLASTAAEGFDGTTDIMPGVMGILPILNGGTGRTDGRASGINGSLPATAIQLWSGNVTLDSIIAVSLEGYRWFFINCNGFWMQGYYSGALLKAFGVQNVGNNFRSAAILLQNLGDNQWKYMEGHGVTHGYGSTNSADLGALTITSIAGMRATGGAI